jgi:hypothetical protein
MGLVRRLSNKKGLPSRQSPNFKVSLPVAIEKLKVAEIEWNRDGLVVVEDISPEG